MATKPKPTGLAAFTQKRPPERVDAAEAEQEPATGRRRGQGATVALTVRLPRAEWERLHQLAVSEGKSIQQLAVAGLSKVFNAKGLPGITL
jgi:hypothetical protein